MKEGVLQPHLELFFFILRATSGPAMRGSVGVFSGLRQTEELREGQAWPPLFGRLSREAGPPLFGRLSREAGPPLIGCLSKKVIWGPGAH